MYRILNLWGEISINVLLGFPSSRLPQVWKLPPPCFSYIWNLLKQIQLALWVLWASALPLRDHWQYFPYHNQHSVMCTVCVKRICPLPDPWLDTNAEASIRVLESGLKSGLKTSLLYLSLPLPRRYDSCPLHLPLEN